MSTAIRPGRRCGLQGWRRSRPFAAGLLLGLGGLELICVSWVGLGFLRFTGTAGAASWTLGALFFVSSKAPDPRWTAATCGTRSNSTPAAAATTARSPASGPALHHRTFEAVTQYGLCHVRV
jgi:hypothetical protein